MATQKEKIDALTAELAEEKKATKRARTERDKYKAQLAERGEKLGSFQGHVVVTNAQQIEKGWRRKNETHGGEYILRYEDGTLEVFASKNHAMSMQKANYYNKRGLPSTIHPRTCPHFICDYAEGCTDQDFGTLLGGDFTAYVDKDKDGKVKSVTLVAD